MQLGASHLNGLLLMKGKHVEDHAACFFITLSTLDMVTQVVLGPMEIPNQILDSLLNSLFFHCLICKWHPKKKPREDLRFGEGSPTSAFRKPQLPWMGGEGHGAAGWSWVGSP